MRKFAVFSTLFATTCRTYLS